MDLDSFLKWLSVYGAVLSTAALAWNIIKARQDKADIKIDVEKQIIAGIDDLSIYSPVIHLSNSGRRPISVVSIDYQRKSEISWVKLININLPVEIHEGRRVTLQLDRDELGEMREIVFLRATDAAGKTYKSSKRPFVVRNVTGPWSNKE
jgi:hypothetical protein